MSQLRCYTCLQLDRKLRPLKAQVKFLFALLCPEMFIKTNDSARYLICWECEFMADKIKRFQTRLKKANEILELSFKGKTTIIEGLSCLKLTAIETISLTQLQSTPILPHFVPMLSENLPILPTNLPMLPEEAPMLPKEAPILPKEAPILPKEAPMLTKEAPILPLNVPMPPKTVPSIPQNILELSLKDMLAIPLKQDAQDEVKVEEEEEGHCSYDFDDLIQPTTIMQVPIDESDPLLIPRLKQPAEIEVPPQKPVKDEIIDPEINYEPQKVFTDAPKEEIELRELRVAVKAPVWDPNLVTDTEITPVLVNKNIAPVKSKKSDELLTKLLSTPSKCEELFLMRQRVPNSNPPKESESREQSSGVACEEDETKLIILNRTELNAHRDKKKHNPAYMATLLKCERCIEWFHSQEKLDEHNLKHDDKSRGNSICEICEQRFANDSLRDEHYRKHFIVYQCNKCPCRYTNRVHLSAHCRKKHDEATFLCRKCFAIFKTFRERSIHIFQEHHQRIRCEECGKTYSNAHMLKEHVLNIHKLKPVECPICKKKVKKRSLKIHMKLHDEKSENGAYCVDCGITYKSKYVYELHLKNSLKHNTIEKLGLKCDHCDTYFATKDSLKNHTEEIDGVKYTCDICKKDSKTKRGLARHIQVIHEGKKRKKKPFPSVCEVCGKSFTLRKSLQEHLNTHLGIRPHVCKDCGDTFTYSAALFTHRRLKHKVKRKFEMTS